MSTYINTLYYAIPTFTFLIIVEIIAAKIKGIKINNSADMISSLSSGLSDTIKNSIKFSVTIVSYSWFLDTFTIFVIEPVWFAVLVAFIVQDFAGYWIHRLNHRVNILWNKHIIHHSSEEFNLSCALRQSISETFRFFTFFWIPAAIMGIPSEIFAIVAPVHLFLQFWYHTRLIDKMGVLEYFLVTPSHHRVHHAINPEYLDKNYSQIFIIWDKLFGTFQYEMADVKPVYGTLRPSRTWNPILINFKHLIQLIKDAWSTKKFEDKFKIWFMPTGWRPNDVIGKYPLSQIENPYEQKKYKTENSIVLLSWTWIQYSITAILMFHLFSVLTLYAYELCLVYALFLLVHIFSYTATLDFKLYAIFADMLKLFLVLIVLYLQNYSWYGFNIFYTNLFLFYLIASFVLTIYFNKKEFKVI